MVRNNVFWGDYVITIVLFIFIFIGLYSLRVDKNKSIDNFASIVGADRVDKTLNTKQVLYQVEKAGGITCNLQSLMDKNTVFLNFWATFCEPCIEELPSLISMARERDTKDFVIVAVSYDESWDVINSFFKDVVLPKNFIVVRDPNLDGKGLKYLFGTEKIPESYLIKSGRVLYRFVNARNWSSVELKKFFDRFIQ